MKMLIIHELHDIFDHLYIFFEIGRENDKEKKKYKEKILVMPGFEPLCARLLDYKKASYTTTYEIHTRAFLPIYPLPVLLRL